MNRPREFPRRPPDVSGLSDRELMALARAMSQDGFRGLVRAYEDAVKQHIYDLVRDRDQTEDIAVTTWDKAFAAFHKYQPRDFEAWLLRDSWGCCWERGRLARPHSD